MNIVRLCGIWLFLAVMASHVIPCDVAAADDSAPLLRYRQAAIHMGVEFEVELFTTTEQAAAAAFRSAFARIAALDKALSDYDPSSELSKLSETSTVPPGADLTRPPPTAKPIRLSDDLGRVLEYSQVISQQSDGAFDVTIGPLTKLWRRARRQKELPTDERLAEAWASVGYQYLKLDKSNDSAQLLRPNMRLDLGGIAKGFAADEGLAAIKKCGIKRALVRASGDIAVGEPPPGETAWRIGIAPLNPDEAPKRFVRLTNQAISTSGDSRQHLVVDGRRYSHIIDPRTGLGVAGRSSVTVIAPSSIEADALATAISVLGAEQGLDLVRKRKNVDLLMVVEDARGQQREVRSSDFEKLFDVPPPFNGH